MKEKFNLSLGQIWLLISAFSLMLPIFLPSANSTNFLENVIGTVTVVMFILSFPCSLFGLPILFFAQWLLGVNPNSMEGLYLNLFLLFVLGWVQWFWIVPRLGQSEPSLQLLNLINERTLTPLSEAKINHHSSFLDAEGKTPLEKVFQEKDSIK